MLPYLSLAWLVEKRKGKEEPEGGESLGRHDEKLLRDKGRRSKKKKESQCKTRVVKANDGVA